MKMTVWFDLGTGVEVGRDCWRFPAPDAALLAEIRAALGVPPGAIQWQTTDRSLVGDAPLVATIQDGQVVAGSVTANPSWQPPAPTSPGNRVLEGLADLAQVVAKNVAASPHDKRFLTQKEIGKEIISWVKANPDCTPDQAEDYIMPLILADLPGQPVVPKLYWVHQGAPHGLAMSYLFEAIKREYCPANTPMTWASLVGLIVATPESQIAAWLRSL